MPLGKALWVYFSQGRNESLPMRMACRDPGLLEVKLMVCHGMDRCRCAVVIWLRHKFFRFWGRLCAMRWGKIIGCGVSYHPYLYVSARASTYDAHARICRAFTPTDTFTYPCIHLHPWT